MSRNTIVIAALALLQACTPILPSRRVTPIPERTVLVCRTIGGTRDCWNLPDSEVRRVMRGER